MQRRITCHYYYYRSGEFVKVQNTSCWYGTDSLIKSDVKEIYIDQFDKDTTRKYQLLLIRLINKITPCEIVEISKKKYIKFTLLQHYNQTLILLNFIRNLWDCPFGKYTEKFFEKLEMSTYIDPLKRLTVANKVACKDAKVCMGGHSNAGNGNTLKLKSKESLLNIKADILSTQSFLTTD